MTRLLAAVIICLLMHLYAVAQNIPGERTPLPGDEKQLLLELKKNSTGIPQIEAILNLSAYYLFLPSEEKNDLDRAMYYALQARELSTGIQFTDGYNEALLLMGKIANEGGEKDFAKLIFDSVYARVSNSVKYNKAQKKPASEARAIRQLVDMRLSQNRFADAEIILLDLVVLYKANGFPNLHYAYERLTAIEIIVRDFNKALLYGLDMMRSMEKTEDYRSAGTFYEDMGYIYLNLGQFQRALEYYNIAYDYFKKNRSSLLYDLSAELAETLIKMNRGNDALLQLQQTLQDFPTRSDYENKVMERALGNCYRQLNLYDIAEVHLKKSIELEKKQKPDLDVLYIYKTMGQAYMEWGKYEVAKTYLEKCLNSKIFRSGELAQIHFMLYKADSAAGKYQQAMEHLRMTKTLDEVANKEIKTRENQELQIQYETEKKDKDLLLQKSKLDQAKKDRNIFIAGVTMLLLTLGLLYNRYVIKQKSNEEINKKNIVLQHLLNEKEWLLKEVHHRVKNNLQTVVSLLESQSAYLDSEALLAIRDSQNRVHVMSLIHQKLYQAENVSSINMEAYLPELINYLRESFNVKNIDFNLQISSVELDVSQAIPVGLIVNEAITNSIKYAFSPQDNNSRITISMELDLRNRITLTVSDNGNLLPADFIIESSGGLGLKLMKGLTEDIHGKFSLVSKNGVTITIIFIANIPFYKLHQKDTLKAGAIKVDQSLNLI
jgi:two-component system, sensor histidine kinase PdtaS